MVISEIGAIAANERVGLYVKAVMVRFQSKGLFKGIITITS